MIERAETRDITELGLIRRVPGPSDATADVPRLGLQLRLLHVQELEDVGGTQSAPNPGISPR